MYSKEEVLKKMDELTLWVIHQTDPATFVLNKAIQAYDIKLKEIQENCPHEFDEDGICTLCGAKQKNTHIS